MFFVILSKAHGDHPLEKINLGKIEVLNERRFKELEELVKGYREADLPVRDRTLDR